MSKTTESWPNWTEDFRWELGPDPEESREASELLNGQDYHSQDETPDDILEQQAGEAAAQSCLDRGIRLF
jgi:hypothetical protein